ncbi:hypothetical protein BYT27DRAFT_7255551 [Phlegmacium glaucopus]|nr:hypothetical protein BYT27DRAFT_7255551 [Phlegmacium glaucopus]
MGGTIVTLVAQLVNLDVLPTKFRALTEIIEDWRLCQGINREIAELCWIQLYAPHFWIGYKKSPPTQKFLP